MADRMSGSKPTPQNFTREQLIAIAIAVVESPQLLTMAPPIAGLPPSWIATLRCSPLGARVESLCRRAFREYSPGNAPAFVSPLPGADEKDHATRENTRMWEAFEARHKFKHALARICDSDEVFRLAPRESLMTLLELRDLLLRLPKRDADNAP